MSELNLRQLKSPHKSLRGLLGVRERKSVCKVHRWRLQTHELQELAGGKEPVENCSSLPLKTTEDPSGNALCLAPFCPRD